MFYSEKVAKAAQLSFIAHKNDLDKGRYPYFMHPLTLAMQFDDEDTVCVALLHDVIEDHSEFFSFDYFHSQGFNENVLTALKLLTHSKEIDYIDYIKQIKQNEIARKVKIADLKHNLDIRRTGGIRPKKYETYLKALEILNQQ